MRRTGVCVLILFGCIFLTADRVGRLLRLICTAFVATPMFARPLLGEQQQVPLGDLAREQRNKQGKDAKKPSRVITNDDLPAHTPDSSPATTGDVSTAAKTEKTGGQVGSDLADSGSRPRDEKYFRSEMKERRKKLEDDRAFLARVHRELTGRNKDLPTGSSGLPGAPSANVWDGPRWQTNPVGAW